MGISSDETDSTGSSALDSGVVEDFFLNGGADSTDRDTDSTDDIRSSEEGVPPTFTGYGPCSRYLCNCKGFEGLGSTCSNCSHAYTDHFGSIVVNFGGDGSSSDFDTSSVDTSNIDASSFDTSSSPVTSFFSSDETDSTGSSALDSGVVEDFFLNGGADSTDRDTDGTDDIRSSEEGSQPTFTDTYSLDDSDSSGARISFTGPGSCTECPCKEYDCGMWANATRCVCGHLRSSHRFGG